MADHKHVLLALVVVAVVSGTGRATAQTGPRLALRALPGRVPPLQGAERRWVTSLLVKLDGPAADDLAVLVSAQLPAVVAMPYVLIPRGHASAKVEVTSHAKGTAETYAWLETSNEAASLAVHFLLPAAQLGVHVDPARGFGIGRAGASTVRVDLRDEDGIVCEAGEDTPVAVRVPLGTLEPASPLVIKAGSFSATAQLIAYGSGKGAVVADADGLRAGEGQVEFGFPWIALVLAMLGGAFGSACRIGFARWPSCALAAAPGFAFGLVVYGFVAFVPAKSLPEVAQSLATLPVTNGLGAAVLGVVGGYLGCRLLGASGARVTQGVRS